MNSSLKITWKRILRTVISPVEITGNHRVKEPQCFERTLFTKNVNSTMRTSHYSLPESLSLQDHSTSSKPQYESFSQNSTQYTVHPASDSRIRLPLLPRLRHLRSSSLPHETSPNSLFHPRKCRLASAASQSEARCPTSTTFDLVPAPPQRVPRLPVFSITWPRSSSRSTSTRIARTPSHVTGSRRIASPRRVRPRSDRKSPVSREERSSFPPTRENSACRTQADAVGVEAAGEVAREGSCSPSA